MYFNARVVPLRLDAFLSGLCRTAGPVAAPSSPGGFVMIVLPIGFTVVLPRDRETPPSEQGGVEIQNFWISHRTGRPLRRAAAM